MPTKPRTAVRAAWGVCSACEWLHGGMWELGGGRRKQTWSLSLPAGSESSMTFSGKRRAQFCRVHVKVTAEFDREFRERHADRELLPPVWWEKPARRIQVDYLKNLMQEREYPE